MAPVPVPSAMLSGHLDHAPAGDSVRLEYGRHYGHQRVRAVLSATGGATAASSPGTRPGPAGAKPPWPRSMPLWPNK